MIVNEGVIKGKKIREIYETKSLSGEDILGLGRPLYFSIIVELEDDTIFELGAHDLLPWNFHEEITPSKGSSWADGQNLVYKGQKIIKIIRRDKDEDVDGSLTLILENGVLIEHQTCNGDQLFIDWYKSDSN